MMFRDSLICQVVLERRKLLSRMQRKAFVPEFLSVTKQDINLAYVKTFFDSENQNTL